MVSGFARVLLCNCCGVLSPESCILNPINPQSLQEVTIADTETQQKIYRLLVYRRTARGRTLQAAFPTLGLPRGSRLEPSAALPDVGLFESLETPFTCKFYIGGERGRVLHDSPFLRIPGVTLESWNIDLLHTWHCGPLSTYITITLRKLLTETDIWKPSIAGLDKEELSKLSLLCLRAELQTHYKLRRQSDPEWSKKGSEAPHMSKP